MKRSIAQTQEEEGSLSSHESMSGQELKSLHALLIQRRRNREAGAAEGVATMMMTQQRRSSSGRPPIRSYARSSYSNRNKTTDRIRPKKKRVRFDSNPRQELLAEHTVIPEDIWYSHRDLSAMKNEAKLTVRALRDVDWNRKKLPKEMYCFRGLEDWTSNTSFRDKKARINTLVDCVLEEQLNQRKMGIRDPTGIQVLSVACSRHAREMALRQGATDEREARHILQSSPRPITPSTTAAGTSASGSTTASAVVGGVIVVHGITASVLENALSLVADTRSHNSAESSAVSTGDVDKCGDSLGSITSLTTGLTLADRTTHTARSA